MKRMVVFSCALMIVLNMLGARTLGYGAGWYGQSVEESQGRVSSGTELSFVYKPWYLPFGNPSLTAKVAVGTDQNGDWVVPYLECGINMDILRTIKHPFNSISQNVIAYTPMISMAYQYDPMRHMTLVSFSASPFKLSAKDFWYEFLVPFVVYDPADMTMDSWGINLIRYTFLFK